MTAQREREREKRGSELKAEGEESVLMCQCLTNLSFHCSHTRAKDSAAQTRDKEGTWSTVKGGKKGICVSSFIKHLVLQVSFLCVARGNGHSQRSGTDLVVTPILRGLITS